MPSRRGRPPRTDAEWAREIQRRVEALESSTSVRVGDWVLNARGKDLIATSPGNKVVLSDPALSPVTVNNSGVAPVGPSNLIELIQQLTGLDLSGPQEFFSSLLALIFDGGGIDLSSPQGLVDSILDLLGIGDGNILTLIAQLLGYPSPQTVDFGDLAAWIAEQVFGFITPDRLPIIPVSHIGDTDVNLLSNPSFADIAINDPTGYWVVDTSVSQDDVGGSAKAVGAGVSQELLSIDLIGVARGQKIGLVAWVKMDAVVASKPDAIQLGVTTFSTGDGSGNRNVTNVATISSYGTRGWQKITGTYTVPESGVVSLRVRIALTEDVTAGTVWFDNMWASKQGLLPAPLVDGLTEFFENVAETFAEIIEKLREFLRIDEWQAFLDNLWLNLTGVRPDTSITADDAADQFALLMATTAAQATTIAQIQASLNAPPAGIVGGDDFERPNGALGTGWKVYTDNSNGTYEIRNGEAVWKREGILANYVRCIRTDPKDAKTATSYQAVTRVTGTTLLQTIALAESADDIVFARVSDDHKAYMAAWWDIGIDGKGRLHLAYNLGSGGEREVQVVPCPKPAAGVPLTLQCGDDITGPYSYRVIRGNTVLIEWDDPAKVTAPIVNNRGWGFGGRSVFGVLGQYAPSSVHSVTAADIKGP